MMRKIAEGLFVLFIMLLGICPISATYSFAHDDALSVSINTKSSMFCGLNNQNIDCNQANQAGQNDEDDDTDVQQIDLFVDDDDNSSDLFFANSINFTISPFFSLANITSSNTFKTPSLLKFQTRQFQKHNKLQI